MTPFSFFIKGTPAPGGSKSAFALRRKDGSIVTRENGYPVINVSDDAGKGNKKWKEAAKLQGRSFMAGRAMLTGAVAVEFVHFIKRPAKHFRTGKFSNELRDDAPQHHIQKPDALKFGRATEDGLTGAVWIDDCTTTRITSEKRWCGPGDEPGCIVTITPL